MFREEPHTTLVFLRCHMKHRQATWNVITRLYSCSHICIRTQWLYKNKRSWLIQEVEGNNNGITLQLFQRESKGGTETNLERPLWIDSLYFYGSEGSWHYIIDPPHLCQKKKRRSHRCCCQMDNLNTMKTLKLRFHWAPGSSTPCNSTSSWDLCLVWIQCYGPTITALRPGSGTWVRQIQGRY